MINSKRLDDFFNSLRNIVMTSLNELQEKLDIFFPNLKYRFDILNETTKEMDRYLSTDFSFFYYINPDENLISNIIAELLKPNGKHGQGDLFLKEFLKIIKKQDEYDIKKYITIKREALTTHIESDRRIDVLIKFTDSAVAIENKPGWGEQEDQIKD